MSDLRPQVRPVVRPMALILGLALFGFAASSIRAQVNQLEIDVRAKIADKPFGKSNLKAAPEHGKVYAILAVQLIPNEEKMVRPVDAHVLLGLVRHELDTHGFRHVVKGQNPEILITIQYGRAWLNNPYFGGEQVDYSGIKGGGPPTREITVGSHVDERQTVAGFESKAQKAEKEKLCIKLTAWQYSTDSKAKAKQLWSTTIVVDDPDHRDLNAIAEEMLKTGAPYFDKEIKEEEVAVYKPMPEGHVNVGTPEVVDRTKTR